MTPPDAAPPHNGPRPPWNGTMNGSNFSGGSSCTGGRDCAALPGDVAPPLSGVACLCCRASVTGWSQKLTSGSTPAAARCTGKRSYWVLYGAIYGRTHSQASETGWRDCG